MLPLGPGIELVNVRRGFGDTIALAGVDLLVEPGRRVGIVGPSGCGKSTLLSIVCGLDEPDIGHVDVHGRVDAAGRLAHCAWMPQQDLLLPWRSVLANARIPLENQGLSRPEASRQVWPLLARFGLAEFADHRPAALSGGMRQRVSFLRTLAAGKPVLLLDEPFGALDSITRADLQDWLRSTLTDEPRTVLLVTHDVEEALLLCDRVAVMSARPGRILETFDVAPAANITSGATRRARLADPNFVALRDAVLASLERARDPALAAATHDEPAWSNSAWSNSASDGSGARDGAAAPEPTR
ncbi:ABC-type nitrate/sulfonate/bicarbonate transport system, ATPase component [Frankia sp. AiPs1]|uniref:ABC transporter ATP-binding protein n=1 Tax=Frankia sp. AiPa1 TaxID=573492 RepID=UPI00202B1CCC|nr:ATP-binding cassette domain-containing protein [Frankia sp. AiPa1]MCL9761478.1 ABC transporter ATP-binding protein [Frankia sp. AiPa1]